MLAAIKSDIAYLLLGKLMQILLMLVAVRAFTHYLSVEEVGNLMLILSMASFMGLVLVNPVGSYINRQLNDWKNDGFLIQGFWWFNYYVFAVAILALLVPLVSHTLGFGQTMIVWQLSLVIALFTYVNTWNQTLVPALNMFFYRKAFVNLTLLSLLLYLLFSIAFVSVFNLDTAVFWLLGQSLGFAVGAVLALWYLYRQFNVANKLQWMIPISRSKLRELLHFIFPVFILTLFLWFMINGYRFYIDYVYGAEALAFVGLGFLMAASLAGSVESLMLQIHHARFYRDIHKNSLVDERASAMQHFVNVTIPVYAFIFVSLSFLSPFLMALLADSTYANAYPYLMIGMLIEFMRASSNVLTHAAHSEYQTRSNISPYILSSLIVAVCLSLFIHNNDWQWWFGFSLVIAWLVNVLFMYKKSVAIIPFYFPWRKTLTLLSYALAPALVFVLYQDLATDWMISLLVCLVSGLYMMVVLYVSEFKVGLK